MDRELISQVWRKSCQIEGDEEGWRLEEDARKILVGQSQAELHVIKTGLFMGEKKLLHEN